MKKLTVIILALALAASLFVSVSAFDVEAPSENGAAQTTESEPINAWSALHPHVYSDGEIIRDDFAGAWVDPGNEHYYYFALTPDADIDFYRNILEGYDNYELVTLKYPLKDLRLLQNSVFERCKDIMSGAGVSEDENLIFFEVRVSEEEENGRVAAAMKAVKEENNLPDGIENAFTVEYGIFIMPVSEAEGEETGVGIPAEGKTSKATEESVK